MAIVIWARFESEILPVVVEVGIKVVTRRSPGKVLSAHGGSCVGREEALREFVQLGLGVERFLSF